MSELIQLSDRRHDGWATGPLVCSACHWQFEAVYPEGTATYLRCPNCDEVALVAVELRRVDVIVIYDSAGAVPREEAV